MGTQGAMADCATSVADCYSGIIKYAPDHSDDEYQRFEAEQQKFEADQQQLNDDEDEDKACKKGRC